MRSVSQIYAEAVNTRNDYLQLTELNSGRSNSKLSILNLLTYVVAVCIHTYEVILDLFQVRLADTLNGRINGTPDWYAMTSKKFQFNSVTGLGDELIFNEDTLKIEYAQLDVSHRIIEKAAWQMEDKALLLKVCKRNGNSNELNNGIPYTQLSDNELTAYKQFIQQIKFIGAEINCESIPGDIVTIVADRSNPIFYDDSYVTASQALSAIQQSMIEFVSSLEFNGWFYYQSVIDVIRKTNNITDLSNNIKIYITSYNSEEGKYNEPIELKGRTRLKSGYVRLLDDNSVMTVNSDNITLAPASKMDEYVASLG